MPRSRAWIAGGLLALSCTSPASPSAGPPGGPPGGPPPGAAPVRALVVTSTAGFRHDAIDAAVQALQQIARSTGELTVTRTENLAGVADAAALASYDVLMFVLTSGELTLDDAQKAAILAFVSGGGGFIGIHSATDTLYSWPDYGRLVGAYFKEHPWTQEAAVTVEDRAHASTSALGPSFRIHEEFYTFRDNPRPSVHVLLSLDAASVGASGDFPLAWTQSFGSGRSYYNALGHFAGTWADPRFQAQLWGAIRWVARRT